MIAQAEGLPEQIRTLRSSSLMSPMHESPCNPAPTDGPSPLPPLPPRGRRGWQRLKPRLGIGSRLTVGLAAVTGVMLLGHAPVTQTTREALEAVRSMQNEHEPHARRASSVMQARFASTSSPGLICATVTRDVCPGGQGLWPYNLKKSQGFQLNVSESNPA